MTTGIARAIRIQSTQLRHIPHDPYFIILPSAIYSKVSRDFSSVMSYFLLTFPYTIVRLTWHAHLNLRDLASVITLSVAKVMVSQ